MSPKYFINDPTQLVNSALKSIPSINPSVALDEEYKIIYRRPGYGSHQVSVVSGGGSGHEPSFAAFVGEGLLAAAVIGRIFESPSAEQVQKCILGHVEHEMGVLVIVMNYTSDLLNFGIAIEKAKASGLKIEMVVVSDDAGIGRGQGGKLGRRGTAGVVLVHKIAGALAAKGAPLEKVYKIAQLTADNLVSIGTSLSNVCIPGRSIAELSDVTQQDTEIEIGVGIRNESGSESRTIDLPGLVRVMLFRLLNASDEDRNFLKLSLQDSVVLLVNNLGGVSILELGSIATETLQQLAKDWNIKPVRVISGTFMTSLNRLGFSITLLRLQGPENYTILELLDAPVEATGWPSAVTTGTWQTRSTTVRADGLLDPAQTHISNMQLDVPLARKALKTALHRLIRVEPNITNYDLIIGNGNCGIELKRGAEAVLRRLDRCGTKPTNDVALFLQNITQVIEANMRGTSGAIYAIILNAMANHIRQQSWSAPVSINAHIWATALQFSLDTLYKYTPARPSDRTLVDALYPFTIILLKTGSIHCAAHAAKEGANETKGMKTSLGKKVYFGGEGWQGVPDPGAYGLSEFLLGLSEGLSN